MSVIKKYEKKKTEGNVGVNISFPPFPIGHTSLAELLDVGSKIGLTIEGVDDAWKEKGGGEKGWGQAPAILAGRRGNTRTD